MTLADQLVEKKQIKAFVLKALTDNVNAGALLGYTTNSTKVTYEGATKTNSLVNQLNSEIVAIEANIAMLGVIT